MGIMLLERIGPYELYEENGVYILHKYGKIIARFSSKEEAKELIRGK